MSIALRAFTSLASRYQIEAMKDIDEIRRENLRIIESEKGGPTVAADLAGMSTSQFSNLREGAKDSKTGKRRGMRKETARRLEQAFGKPTGWLDVEHGEAPTSPAVSVATSGSAPAVASSHRASKLWPFSQEVLLSVAKLGPEARRKAENVLRSHLDLPPLPRVENKKAA